MELPPRLAPLVEQFDWGRERLMKRLVGPDADSGDDTPIPVEPLTDAEYLWEPVPGSWSIRRKSDGPGQGATVLVGGGDWGRDGARPHPTPPPVTTIAWRLAHLTDGLSRRADYTTGAHALTVADLHFSGSAAEGIAGFDAAAAAWREAMISADDAALDQVGRSSFPDGSDSEELFIGVVWWVNHELLHHGAEIALLRDLYRAGLYRP